MAITAEMTTSVMELYTAYFNRAADKDGVDYWLNEMDTNGWTIDQVAQSFAQQTEYTAIYAGLTNAQIVAQVYTNVLGRTADTAGAAYWEAELDGGIVPVSQFIQAVVNAAKEDVDNLGDDDIVANKTAVSQYYYDNNRNDTNVSLTAVTADTATVDTAKAALDAVINAGETFTLTKAVDDEVVNGTAAYDTFDASELGSLQDDDIILDSSTTDTDTLNASVNTNATAARIQNVEVLNIDGKYVATGFNFTNVSNAQVANFNTEIAGGTATITGANSLNVATIKAGSNIATLDITSLASGTRDTVTVDAGSADLNLTGMAAGADSYNATVAADATVTLATLASANDAVTLNVAGDLTLDAGVAADNAELDITINATTANSEVTLSDATNINAEKMILTGSKDITLVVTDGVAVAGTVAVGVQAYDGTLITSTSTGTTTLEIETLAATAITAGNDFSRAKVDVVELSNDIAGAAGIILNENTKLNLTSDLTAGNLTVALDHGDENATAFTQGTLIVNVSEAQTNSIIADATVNTIIIEATPDEVTDLDLDENGFEETTMLVDDVTFDATTDVMVVQGAENIKFTTINVTAVDQVIAATNMTGKLTISAIVGAFDDITIVGGKGNDSITTNAVQIYDVQSGEGNDTINIANAKAGTEVTSGAGNDTITSSANAATIDAGAGDDTVTAAGSDTITLGAGADVIKLDDNLTAVVVNDFVMGTDIIELTAPTAALTVAFDVTDVLDPTSGAYIFADAAAGGAVAANEYAITLKNGGSALTATDFSSSLRLNGVTLFDTSTNVLGDLNDSVKIAADESATITTGAGSDTVTIAAGALSMATIKDFTVGTDKVVVTGAITTELNVNLNNVTSTAGVYTIGDATLGQSFDLENGGSDIVTENNLTSIVQLGSSATVTFDASATADDTSDVTVTGGTFNDFVSLTGADAVNDRAIFNFSNNGGVDYVELTTGLGEELVNFNNLTGIDSTAAKVDVTANQAKIADATDKGVYVFASSADGAGSAKITTFVVDAANGYTQDVINDEVAAFINAGLGAQDGEKYVVVINDESSATYVATAYGTGTVVYESYAYLVTGDADGVQADDITLIGMINDGSVADVITTADIA
ncbi:MAG: beta strand repeat-containing protein [Sulfurimonas sp.]|uniref:beta strand repeat-containing protein n=1 Tax=Sulfurimonas sp. TaxID=2022749 RepID=UPI003D0E04BD